jgi:hypothetical protein
MSGRRKKAPVRWAVVTSAVLVMLAACGSTTVTVNIDALSFIPDDDRVLEYGEDPAIPPVEPPVPVESPVFRVPIAGELENVTEIDRVDIAVDVEVDNDTGSANATLEFYVAGEDEDPFETPTLLEGDLVMAPDTSYTAAFLAEGDERVIGLFSGNELAFSVRALLDATGGENLRGRLELTGFDIVVTGTGGVGSD